MAKALVILALAISLAFTAAPASAADGAASTGSAESSAGEIVLDIVIARPLGLAAIVLGTGVFVVGLPFTIPSGSVGVAAKELIAAPFRYTFVRPLGFGSEY